MASKNVTQSTAPGFVPNFHHNYQVTISQPASEVFSVIGTSAGHIRTVKLSKLATTAELNEQDTVSVPKTALLSELNVRTLPKDTTATSTGAEPLSTRSLPRQFFKFAEKVPLLGGLVSHTVHLAGSLTWDEENQLALYETKSDNGILVWKLRRIEEVDASTTKVTETIHGKCPGWLRSICQKTTAKGHKAHMDEYHTLFA